MSPIHTPSMPAKRFASYTARNVQELPQMQKLSPDQRFAIDVVSKVFHFKTNSYVVDELIDWDAAPDDPCFRINFPQEEMLKPEHFRAIADLLISEAPEAEVAEAAHRVRMELNPHPAGQLEHNVPLLGGRPMQGMQHKYGETVLFFPSHGQACHSHCTFCFRWPQFIGVDGLKFEAEGTDQLIAYLRAHPEVSDILITGGDPIIMSAARLAAYVDPILKAGLPNLKTIRIGSKAMATWPYRFTADPDSGELLRLFERITESGHRFAFMAHFNHPKELGTTAAREACARILSTGASIHTQSPILAGINDSAEIWEELWKEQHALGCKPYYMFVVRDTGAQHYFGVPLLKAWEVFRGAYSRLGGLMRAVRGPVMSTHYGKVQILGPVDVGGEQALALQFVQARDRDWTLRPFLASMDRQALWLDALRPFAGEGRFFFESAAHAGKDICDVRA